MEGSCPVVLLVCRGKRTGNKSAGGNGSRKEIKQGKILGVFGVEVGRWRVRAGPLEVAPLSETHVTQGAALWLTRAEY